MAGESDFDLNGVLAQMFRVGPTDDEKKAAFAQALTRGGLGMLAANQPSRLPVNSAGVLAQGIGSGLDAYQGTLDRSQTERKANGAMAMQGLQFKKQMEQQQALQQYLAGRNRTPPTQLASAGGMPAGGFHEGGPWAPGVPTQPVPQQPQVGPQAGGFQPHNPADLERLQASGVNIEPFLKLNAEARPDVMHIDAGNEIIVQDKKTMRELARYKKGAAPGSVPLEASDLTPAGYRDFLTGKATAGAAKSVTNVNSFMPASEEAQRDFIKSTRGTYDQLKHAPVLLDSLEKAKALVPQARGFMGPGGDSMLETAKFMNNRLGMSIDTEGVKNAEELRTRIFFNIMDNLKKMDASPSQQQQQIMREALGNLGTDPNALPRVLDAFGDVIRGKVDLHNKEVNGATQRGVKFPYDPVINLPTAPQAPQPAPAQPAQGQFPNPNTQAIARLRMNPGERAMFEAKFGPGSAGRYLGK